MKRFIIIFAIMFCFAVCGCTKTENNKTTVIQTTSEKFDVELPNKIYLASNETANIFELLDIDTTGMTTKLKTNAGTKLSCGNDGTLITQSDAKNIKVTIQFTKGATSIIKNIYVDIVDCEIEGIDSNISLYKDSELSFNLSLTGVTDVEYSYYFIGESKATVTLDGNKLNIKSANEDKNEKIRIVAKSGTIIKNKDVLITSSSKSNIIVTLSETEIGIIDDNKIISAVVKKNDEIINQDVSFVSSDLNVLTIDNTGMITRVSENGFAKIYAKTIYDGAEYYSEIANAVVFSNTSVKFDNQLTCSTYGRNEKKENSLTLYETNSGFELYIYGDRLDVKFQQAGIKIRIVADGVETTKIITQKNMNLALFDEVGLHKIYVAKASNSWHGRLTVESLTGAMYYSGVEEKKYKFLFYGDSITVGYGINADGTDDSVSNEDGTKTWAGLVRDYYDAENQTLCKNGISAGAKIHVPELMYEIYDQVSYKYSVKYDMSLYDPDLIMINLGTNDNTAIMYPGYYLSPLSARADDITEGYINLIDKLKEVYPNAKIICMYGMMKCYKNTSEAIRKAVDISNESYDGSIYYLEMKEVSLLGEGDHPDYLGHSQGAKQVIDFIEKNNILE